MSYEHVTRKSRRYCSRGIHEVSPVMGKDGGKNLRNGLGRFRSGSERARELWRMRVVSLWKEMKCQRDQYRIQELFVGGGVIRCVADSVPAPDRNEDQSLG